MIKTYRGQMADDSQDHIRLGTPQGKVGYRIRKLQIMGEQPAGANQESVVKIYKNIQTSYDAVVDFSDSSLLAAAYLEAAADAKTESQPQVVIFDNEIVNQDIFITHKDSESGEDCNFYLELEQVKLSEQEALVSIVKNLRNQP